MELTEIKAELSVAIGKKIRQIRLSQELNQVEFGKIIGVHKDQISRYELGKNTPRPDLLKKIADFGQISVEELLEDLTKFHEKRVGYFKKGADSDVVVSDLMNERNALCEENKELLRQTRVILESDDHMVRNSLASNIRTFFDRLRKEDRSNGPKSPNEGGTDEKG